MYPKEELLEFPSTYNYPLHLFTEDVTGNRPSTLEELVTILHEGFYRDSDWFDKMPAKAALKTWITEKLDR